MVTKPVKTRRAPPRKKKKTLANGRPKRHPWTRVDGEIHRAGFKIGYARVSTLDQNLALQEDALKEAGCGKIFIEQMSGAVRDRPALLEVLDYARSGDTLIVWKLDRLARSMKQLIETIEKLRLRNIGFRSLTEVHRHHHGARRLDLSYVQRVGRVRARPHSRANARGPQVGEAHGPHGR